MGQELPVTSYALLGLLTFGDELTGYELKQRADFTLRFYWVSPAMSQVYSELSRLTESGLVEPSGEGRGRRYRITEQGRKELKAWMDSTSAGFPVLKHPVLLRLLMGHLTDAETIKTMLREYVDQLNATLADLDEVRESLRGADAPGEAFRHPSLVADWGLAYFASEAKLAEEMIVRLDE